MILTAIIILLCLAFVLAVCYLLFIGLLYLIAMVVTLIQLRTGKLTREQLAANAAKYEERKRQEKKQKRICRFWQDLTYSPPPGLGKLFGHSIIDVAMGRC